MIYYSRFCCINRINASSLTLYTKFLLTVIYDFTGDMFSLIIMQLKNSLQANFFIILHEIYLISLYKNRLQFSRRFTRYYVFSTLQ